MNPQPDINDLIFERTDGPGAGTSSTRSMSEPAPSRTRDEVITFLSQEIDRVLSPLIPPGSPCALLDFPEHFNIGDSAIWLGQRAWLRKRGVRTIYVSTFNRSVFRALKKRLGRSGVLLLSGGGNLGDLYPVHQRFREELLTTFPDNTIIQLPQTLHFQSQENLQRAVCVLNSHRRFYLLVRGWRSLEIARASFRIPSELCPDMAFALGPLSRPAVSPRYRVLWLWRRDNESSQLRAHVNSEDTVEMDWPEKAPTLFLQTTEFLIRQVAEHPRKLRALQGPLSLTYDLIAARKLAIGTRILSQGRVIVTDRLHGHILSLLLGIPHVLLDNQYGKVRRFYRTWTKGCSLIRWANWPEEAQELAGRLAEEN